MMASAAPHLGSRSANAALGVTALVILAVSAVLTENFLIQWALYPIPFSFFVLSIVVIIGLAIHRIGQSISFDRAALYVLISLFAPMLLSAVWLPVAILLQPNWYINPFILEAGFWGRLINIVLYMFVFVFVSSLVVSRPEMLRRLAATYVTCLIVLLAGAYWQITSFRFGVPFPNFGMETQVHGVDASVRQEFSGRLTSFVREPAFLVSFMFDMIILSTMFLPKRSSTILILLSVPVIILTFSISAVVHVVWIAGLYGFVRGLILVARLRTKPSAVMSAIFFVAGLAVALVVSYAALSPYADRIGRILDNPTRDTRIFELWATYQATLASPLATAIFGHGPGSYAILQYVDIGLGKSVWHQTSNNQYADTLFETGVFGLFCIALLVVWMVGASVKLAFRNPSIAPLALMAIHLAGTGLFKAQIFNLRYYVMLWIFLGILALYRAKPENIIYSPRQLVLSITKPQ